MRVLYNAALVPMRAASLVFGAWPRGSESAALERDQRLGRRLPEAAPGGIWLHGASVGEARIVGALARAIRERLSAAPLLASAVTPTGRAMLPAPPAVDAAFFLPLDFPVVQRRAFDALRPSVLVLVETELWPNLLSEAIAREIPIVLVNARLAPERASRYRWLAGLYRPLLAEAEAVGVAGPDEVARFIALGARPETIRVVGNLKFDLPAPTESGDEIRRRCGVSADRPVVAAGSTGEGEDAIVLDAFEIARAAVPDLLLVLAPRHPARFEPAVGECARRGLGLVRLSTGAPVGAASVLLVDTVGRLASLYAIAGSAFVGGSLVPVGGHNVLEPLAAGAPVLFGPHTEHVEEIATMLERAGAGERVRDAGALGRAWARLATDPDERGRRLAIGGRLCAAHRGALARAADLVVEVARRRGAKGRA
jgi:3-deoxy-D-manno-octulosonic-acid transferase